jgi:hypothetical protein
MADRPGPRGTERAQVDLAPERTRADPTPEQAQSDLTPEQAQADLTPEWTVLVACARHAIASAGAEAAGGAWQGGPGGALAGEPVDWGEVLELANRHGLSAFLQRFLDQVPRLEAPPAVRERLRERVRLRARENLRLTGSLIALVPAMEAEGIETVAYKGPVLSERLYGSPALRDYDDLDLLVRERDVDRATRLLEARGLRPWFDLKADQEARLSDSQYARHFGDEDTGLAVDLHWGFAQPSLSFRIDEASLWAQTERVTLGGARIRTLDDSLLLLLLCVHGSKHEPYPWYRLKWIVDVAGLALRVPDEGWDPLIARARQLRLERPFLFGLLVAQRLLAIPLTPLVAARLRDAHDLESLTDAVVATLTAPGDGSSSGSIRVDYDLRLLDRWQDRARYVLHRLFVPNPKDWAAVELPPWLAPAYYLLRPFRLWSAALSRRLGRTS